MVVWISLGFGIHCLNIKLNLGSGRSMWNRNPFSRLLWQARMSLETQWSSPTVFGNSFWHPYSIPLLKSRLFHNIINTFSLEIQNLWRESPVLHLKEVGFFDRLWCHRPNWTPPAMLIWTSSSRKRNSQE